MALYLPAPLPATILPQGLANLLESGGTKYSEFLAEHCSVDNQAIDSDCAICWGRLDPTTSNNEYEYLSGNPAVPHEQDRMIMRNDRCSHVFHTGCFHNMVQLGMGRHICPTCRREWYTSTTMFRRINKISNTVDRIVRGDFSEAHFMQLQQPVRVCGSLLFDGFALAAFALKKKHKWNDQLHLEILAILHDLASLVGVTMEGGVYVLSHLAERLSGWATHIITESMGLTAGGWNVLFIMVELVIVSIRLCYCLSVDQWI